MKKNILFLVLLISYLSVLGQSECSHCNIEVLKRTESSIDSLSNKEVRLFLCSLDSSCVNNVEFSEWSNELLFKVLNKKAETFLMVLEGGENVNTVYILSEIEAPIIEIDIQSIYNKVKNLSDDYLNRNYVLNALIIAGGKQGLIIKK